MGAAATTSHADVEMIVFLAILLHKAPASFGFVSYLLSEGLDRSRVKRHLLCFSLSAPIASFITYFGISASAKEALSDYNATGNHSLMCLVQIPNCYSFCSGRDIVALQRGYIFICCSCTCFARNHPATTTEMYRTVILDCRFIFATSNHPQSSPLTITFVLVCIYYSIFYSHILAVITKCT